MNLPMLLNHFLQYVQCPQKSTSDNFPPQLQTSPRLFKFASPGVAHSPWACNPLPGKCSKSRVWEPGTTCRQPFSWRISNDWRISKIDVFITIAVVLVLVLGFVLVGNPHNGLLLVLLLPLMIMMIIRLLLLCVSIDSLYIVDEVSSPL